MVNEFAEKTYNCDTDCHCVYQTELASVCKISDLGVLDLYGYKTGQTGEGVEILLAIVLGYRLLVGLRWQLRSSDMEPLAMRL